MKKTITLCCLLATLFSYGQENVGIGTDTPNSKAALDITASGKGLLIPRMDSVTRVAITNPPDGLMVFQNDGRKGFWYAINDAWLYIPDKATANDNLGNHSATQNVVLNDNDIQLRATADSNHGLGWYDNAGSAKNWAGQNIDGPVLYGNFAGVLGTTSNGKKSILKWTKDGRIGVNAANPAQQLQLGTVNYPKPAFVRYSAGNGTANREWETGTNVNANNPGDVSGENYDFAIRDVTGNATRLLINYQNGSVGINNINPQTSLDVTGTTTSDAYSYKTAQTRTLSIPLDAFALGNDDVYTPKSLTVFSNNLLPYTIALYLRGGTLNNAGYVSAPVNLPDGATITGLAITAIDNDGNAITPTATLSAIAPNPSGGVSILPIFSASVALSSESNNWQTASALVNHTVNNAIYTYRVVVKLNQNTAGTLLYGVRITYTVQRPD